MFSGIRGNVFRLSLLSSVIPLLTATALLYFIARSSISNVALTALENTVNTIKHSCQQQSDEFDVEANRRIARAWEIAQIQFAKYLPASFGQKKQKITITNQNTEEKVTIELPSLFGRETELNNNNAIVDELSEKAGILGTTATVFCLFDNKLIRIATNVKTKEGKRAVYSYIPSDSLVYKNISENRSYSGRALVVGQWMMAHYQPIVNQKREVIGALYVGIPTPKTNLYEMIKGTKVSKNGYVYIINSLGQFIEHPTLKGNNIFSLEDLDGGEHFGKTIIDTKEGHIEYSFKTKFDQHVLSRKAVAYYSYFEPWDWYIVSTANNEDIFSEINTLFTVLVIMLFVFIFGLFFVSNYFASKITKPFRIIIETAKKVASGDLTAFIRQPHYYKCYEVKDCTRTDCPAHGSRNRACWRINGTYCNGDVPMQIGKSGNEKIEKYCINCEIYQHAIKNEVDELIESLNNMIVTLRRIVDDIQKITNDLNEKATTLADISSSMENATQNQAALIEETSSANEELIASIENVANAANIQAQRVSQTSAAMEELMSTIRLVGENSTNVSRDSQATVEEAKRTGEMLNATTLSIQQISESSRKITDITAMINDISDQINLLSLNASIEAARAGEHGRGFAVVAEEISKLADATSTSSKEIHSLINTSQNDIETGAKLVLQMANAITAMIQKIERSAELIKEIALSSEEQILGSEQVMHDVEDVNNMATQIANATGEQKSTSTEILKAVGKINEAVQEVANSAQFLANFAISIKELAKNLKDITSQFTVKSS